MALQTIKQTALIVGGANTVGFLITAIFKTHKITDLVGVGSFVLATLQFTKNSWSFIFEQSTIPWFNNRLFWINAGVILWGTRLSSYLFHRILHTEEDKRLHKFFPSENEGFFDRTRSNFPINLSFFWSVQALWGVICLLPVSLINSIPASAATAATATATGTASTVVSVEVAKSAIASLNVHALPVIISKSFGKLFSNPALTRLVSFPFTWLPIAGIFTGIAIESIADYQKSQYRANKKNENHWCDVGLWSLSRYPNYFGEILTWWSIYAASLPSLLQISAHPVYRFVPPLVGLLSPTFITWLLFKLSGIPLLEKKQQKQFGENAEYQKYVKETPLLIPIPKGLFPGNKKSEL